ncbi:MAG TPA: BON domain-containing protein [Dokdonella sp.]|uniref:BON domain-containing protein n=1 Tax=Dokdonella sp. TaxID=2291710 RepID=UPI002CC72B44|nr:BON domain-containing protein [Dokdonella sp.]HUD40800.1 BON domain-containing protein [Dokdonella sp.]
MTLIARGLVLASAGLISLSVAADPAWSPAGADEARKTTTEDRGITATDQPNNPRDLDLAAAVRAAIVDDETLSTAAKNVTLVAASGQVTLRGTVDSAEEKARIERLAAGVAGVTEVRNDITVKAR